MEIQLAVKRIVLNTPTLICIRIASIVFWLVLQRTPLNSNNSGGVFSSYSCSPFDLGVLFTDLKEFSNQRKYDVITNVWKSDGDFIFSQSKEGRKRRFSSGWLKSFSWLVYSKYLDGAFCLPCAFFAKECGRNSNKLDKLVKSPLTFWTTAFQRLTSHSNGKCQTHNFSVVAMNNFIRSMRQEVVPIDQQLNTLRQ